MQAPVSDGVERTPLGAPPVRLGPGWLVKWWPQHSLFGRIALVLLLVNGLATALATQYIHREKSAAALAAIDGRLAHATLAAPFILGHSFLDAADPQRPLAAADYLSAVRRLHRYCEQAGISYLYVFARRAGETRYVMDSAPDDEIARGFYGQSGAVYRMVSPALEAAFAGGSAQHAETTDEFGSFRSVFQPYRQPGGEWLVIGADMSLSMVDAARVQALHDALGLGLLAFTLGLLLSMGLARALVKPLERMIAVAQRIAHGDYHGRVASTRRDELGLLAHAMDTMAQAIESREREIWGLAYEDTLTGLPNQVRVQAFIGQQIAEAQINDQLLVVLVLGINRFRYINDTLGYPAGDAVLMAVAHRLQAHMATGDAIARLGGDKFALVLRQLPEEAIHGSVARVLRLMEEPLMHEGYPLDVGGSAGVTVFPRHGQDAATLLERAEMAMFLAKRSHAEWQFYDPAKEASRVSSLSLASELKAAVERNQLCAFLQPKVALVDGRVCGVEALVRWRHPERGWVQPGQFIPFAEQTGRIRDLTRWMLLECLLLSRQWDELRRNVRISVNVSVADIEDPQFVGIVHKLLQQTGANPDHLCLEVTESGMMSDPQAVLGTLHSLRALGIYLSIDDFGTGYSSLAYLARLPVQELKIDGAFIRDMNNPTGAKVVQGIAEMGHALNLSVVAEGVEDLHTWHVLRGMQCDVVQGYVVAKPMPAAEFEKWFADRGGYWLDGQAPSVGDMG